MGDLGFLRSLLGRASLRSLSLVGDREKRLEKFRSLAGVAKGDELRAAVGGLGVSSMTLSRLLRSPIVVLVVRTSDGVPSSAMGEGAELVVTIGAPSITTSVGSSPALIGPSAVARPEEM